MSIDSAQHFWQTGHIPVDITFHPSWWHRNAGVSFGKRFFYDNNYRLEADVEMRRTLYRRFGHLGLGEKEPKPRPILGSDLIASGFIISEMLGCPVEYTDDNPPLVHTGVIGDDEVDNLEAKDVDAFPFNEMVRQAGELESKFGRVEPSINLQGVQNIAFDLRGIKLYEDYLLAPDRAIKVLRVAYETLANVIGWLRGLSPRVSAGVASIVKQMSPELVLTSNCTVEVISNRDYERFLLEFDQKLADRFQPFGIHHCGKSFEHVIDGYSKVRGVDFFEIGWGSDIAASRARFPNTKLNLRYSPVKMATASPAEIREDIERMIELGSPKDLLAISVVGLDVSVPDENIEAFFQAVYEYGRL